ncbi:unnamed protein product [Didymodactylos carnosus]|uniref:Uncharacterized protein n=1 Tax=Didymodactylos carnosus TaxID=1234261 RepID=A0A815VBC5_9BILA|nr:unnamed protein product [Didymodactylos carnosus]CAF1533622.1 unnamed protein product [Didymodactylos carnosus]CAF3623755.1 unnamed protein product [Didymodactylos carnosus]CAF4393153.1 unnamed protein product [Didymodactylos carnosus]
MSRQTASTFLVDDDDISSEQFDRRSTGNGIEFKSRTVSLNNIHDIALMCKPEPRQKVLSTTAASSQTKTNVLTAT